MPVLYCNWESQLNFSYMQVNALMEPFHILLMWQSSTRVRLLLSIAAPLGMRNPIFVAPSSLVKLTIALALVNGFIFCCAVALYGWKAADFLRLKATRLPGWKLEFGGDQRSPISPARGKVAAFQSELRRMNITDGFEDRFSLNISFSMTLPWKMFVFGNTKVCNKHAPLTSTASIKSWCVALSDPSSALMKGLPAGETTNCWYKQTDTSPQYTSFPFLIPGKSLESLRGHFRQHPHRRHLHSSVKCTE